MTKALLLLLLPLAFFQDFWLVLERQAMLTLELVDCYLLLLEIVVNCKKKKKYLCKLLLCSPNAANIMKLLYLFGSSGFLFKSSSLTFNLPNIVAMPLLASQLQSSHQCHLDFWWCCGIFWKTMCMIFLLASFHGFRELLFGKKKGGKSPMSLDCLF